MQEGLSNVQPPHITKSIGQILRDNICTLFNALNFGLAFCLLLVGSYSNLLFMGVVLCNLLIGTIQQLRSKRTVEKLSVLYQPRAQVVREGKQQELPLEELVLDDVICLRLGVQIPTDATLVQGEVEVNEALLTGEADPLIKRPGDILLSGSFVVSGEARAQVEHVGADNYAAKLALEARQYKKIRSDLMRALRRIIRFTGSAVLPLGALLFFRSYFIEGHAIKSAVEQTAGAMIGMIPSGLMLLASVSLAVGVVTLSRRKTLVQEMYCIETLSRVDMLCLDKTGTLTAGRMDLNAILHREGSPARQNEAQLEALINTLPKGNATAAALATYFSKQKRGSSEDFPAPSHILPFSSARKFSAANFPQWGSLYLGAPEILCPALPEDLARQAEQYLEQGCRILLFSRGACQEDLSHPPKDLTPLSLIVLEDALRPEASQTLSFFLQEGVAIKLISGDNPHTVKSIARRLGLPGYDAWVDATTLQDEQAVRAAATRYTIFGRVSPQQKRWLVQALKAAGHTVAMTGDGVNDVLALKDADCSVAMAAGSDAARQVSQLVLLDNNFNSLPAVVMEGRRVINNITRTSSLFLVKTIFSFLLTVCSVLLGLRYPFQPVQLSLISALTIGLPSFVLALEPNRSRITGNFLENVLTRALPGALCVFLYALLASIIGPWIGLDAMQVNTLCVYLTGIAGLCVLLRVCLPLNLKRGVLWGCMACAFLYGAIMLRQLLHIGLPTGRMLFLLLPLGALCYPLLASLGKVARHIVQWVKQRKILPPDAPPEPDD